jgi:hypothetical protein
MSYRKLPKSCFTRAIADCVQRLTPTALGLNQYFKITHKRGNMFRIEDAEGNYYILEIKVVQKLPGYGDWRPQKWEIPASSLFGESLQP